jgi:hypothetical protein
MSAALSSCVSVMEKAGNLIDGTAFAEKTIALYQSDDLELAETVNKSDEHSYIITLKTYPMMKLRCAVIDDNFNIVSLEYLSGGAQGWNEFTLELTGAGTFVNGALTIDNEIESVQISAGRIQRYDTRITGAAALTGLRNRYERIQALNEWMSKQEAPRAPDIKTFEKYWKPVLFPELVSKKLRPESWAQEGDSYVKSEDIRWNTSYTERNFPEHLLPVRNSGTLLRDWEEALSWIYLEYEWENIKDTLSRHHILTKRGK